MFLGNKILSSQTKMSTFINRNIGALIYLNSKLDDKSLTCGYIGGRFRGKKMTGQEFTEYLKRSLNKNESCLINIFKKPRQMVVSLGRDDWF